MSNDQLFGGPGNDQIFGGIGNDTLFGEEGNDSLFGENGDDRLSGGSGQDLIDGGAGFDLADYTSSSAGVVIRLDGGANSRGDAEGDVLVGIEGAIGSEFNDFFITSAFFGAFVEGRGGADVFFGNSGDDRLFGGNGNDIFLGRGGADLLDGGSGFDLANYRESASAVVVRTDGGLSRGGDAEGDILRQVEGVIGSDFDDFFIGSGFFGNFVQAGAGNDTFFGNDLGDRFFGGDGNDILLGRGGADTLDGGAGFDIANYQQSAAGVVARLDGGLGSGGDAEGDQLLLIEAVVGSNFDDTFISRQISGFFQGARGNDIAFGNVGFDRLFGDDGNDTLLGGRGSDTLGGGAGDDLFVFADGDGTDTIDDFSGNDVISLRNFGAAFDTIGEVRDATTEVEGGVEIDFGGGDVLFLRGIDDAAQLEVSDFDFV